MEVDTKTEKKTLCYTAPNFSTDNRYEHPSTEEFLRVAREIMKKYDKAFRKLAE